MNLLEQVAVLAEILEDIVNIYGKKILYKSLDETSGLLKKFDNHIQDILKYPGNHDMKKKFKIEEGKYIDWCNKNMKKGEPTEQHTITNYFCYLPFKQ